MRLSYNKLWKLLIDRGMKKGELRDLANISQSTMAKLSHDENVTSDILAKICAVLGCDIGDIATVVVDEKNEN